MITADASTAAAPAASPGARVDRFVLSRKLGAGGMGEVWEANDPALGRAVALKLLRVGGAERMVREARAMARLDHPNVATVYDTGVDRGRVWVAMELVAGGTLRAVIERRSPWREVVQRFVEAGRGLAAAHRAGLIHRDFKPDNVLLRSDGRAVVADFGLARDSTATGAAALVGDDPVAARSGDVTGTAATVPAVLGATAAGSVVGTPAYMAPEQHLGGEVDARADQFAFCVSLWEAVFGAPPFRGAPGARSERIGLGLAITRGQRAPTPDTPRIPRWLLAVLERGLAVERADRHPSMTDVVARLERGLARRRRTILASAGGLVVAVVAVVAVGATLVGDREPGPDCRRAADPVTAVWNRDAGARIAASFATSRRPHAAATRSRVSAELDARAAALAGARVEACEATHVRGEQSARALDQRMSCLDQRLVELRTLVELLGRDATDDVIDQASEAVSGGPPAERCRDATRGAAPALGLRPGVDAVRAAVTEARALLRAGKADDALVRAGRLVAVARALAFPPLVAEALALRADALADQGAAAAGEVAYQEAAVAAAAAGDDRQTADALIAQIELLTAEGGRAAAALERLGPAEVASVRAADPEIRESFSLARAAVYSELARHDDARRDLEAARASVERRAGTAGHAAAQVYSRLASALWDLGRTADALQLDQRALAIWTALLGPDHPKVGQLLNNLGIRLETAGDYPEARRVLERSLSIKERTLGPDHPSTAFTLNNLGLVALDQGRDTAGTAYYERALAIRERALGPDHPMVATSLSNLAIARRRANRLGDALALHQRALAIRERAFGAAHPSVAQTLGLEAVLLAELRRFDEALVLARRALAIREQVHGPVHERVANALAIVGHVLQQRGDQVAACPLHQRAIAILEQVHGPRHPDLAAALTNRADCLVATRRAGEAVASAERAVAIAAASGVDPVVTAEARFGLARAAWAAAGAPVAGGAASSSRARAIELGCSARRAAAAPSTAEQAKVLARTDAWLAARGQRCP